MALEYSMMVLDFLFIAKILVSTYQHDSELEERLLKELNLRRIEGPFEERPLQNLRVSPFGLVTTAKTAGSG